LKTTSHGGYIENWNGNTVTALCLIFFFAFGAQDPAAILVLIVLGTFVSSLVMIAPTIDYARAYNEI
jgi:hypothetical protein